jgi:predicted nucleotidyltransferase
MNSKEQYIISLIKSRIAKKNPDAEIVLFGSHARGQANLDSDWDILILLNNIDVSRKIEREYREELFDIELEVGEPISTFVYSKRDWESKYSVTPLYQNIKHDGILLT